MEQRLLIDSCGGGGGLEFQLNESASKHGLVKFRGKFQEAEAINKNKRMYPYDVLDENVKRLQEAMESRSLLGELDHPTDSIIHYANASHIVTKLWWENSVLMGEGEILNTPHGKLLKSLIDDGVRVGISSRGVGNGTTNEDGILVIGESYKLITFDAVADPSTFAAYQEKVVTKENVSPAKYAERQRETPDSQKSIIKNESSRIDTVNKDVLLALLDGFVSSQTQKFKSRLG